MDLRVCSNHCAVESLNRLYKKMWRSVEGIIFLARDQIFYNFILFFQVIDIIDTAPQFNKPVFAAGITVGDKVNDLVTTLSVSIKFQLTLIKEVTCHRDIKKGFFWTVHFHNWRKEQTNKMHKINFGLINLLLFNHSNMFRPLYRSHHQGVQNPWELQAIVVIC